MTWHAARNFATTTASSGALNNTTSPITFGVSDGTVFGSTFPMWAVVDPTGSPELIEITARSGNNITATRASAAAHAGSPTVACTVAADYIDELQDAVDLKAPAASPTFTGTPVAPTASPGTNTTQIATTAFVTAAVGGGGGGSSEYAVLRSTSSQSIAGGSLVQLTFNSVVQDTSTLTDTANQFTVPSSGMYLSTLTVGFSSSTTSRIQIAISANGAAGSNDPAVLTFAQSKDDRDANEYWPINCSGMVYLSANDEVFAYAYVSSTESTSNTTLADFPFAYFTIAKVG